MNDLELRRYSLEMALKNPCIGENEENATYYYVDRAEAFYNFLTNGDPFETDGEE